MHTCLGLTAVFVIVFFVQLGTREELGFRQWNAGPFTEALQLETAKVFNGEVWRVFTHAFLHNAMRTNSLMALAVTVIFLIWIGRHVEDIYGWQEFLGFCLVAALLGGIGFVVGSIVTGKDAVHFGPSGLITAVLLLYALHYPQRTVLLFFFLPTPVWLLVVFYAMFDVVGFFGGQLQPAVIFCHLFAASFAFLYHHYHLRVTNWMPSFSTTRVSRRKLPTLRIFEDVTAADEPADPQTPTSRPTPNRPAPLPDTEPEAAEAKMDEQLEAQMDAVLEKMNKYGKESLSEDEWAILRRASEACQKRRRQMG